MTSNKSTILLVHGPNLAALGRREPSIYGFDSLQEIEDMIVELAKGLNIEVKCFQSNVEGNIIDYLFEHGEHCQGIIINPGALAHYSLALADCLRSLPCPKVEVHLSNLFKREEIRQHPVTASACDGVIMGMGKSGYHGALGFLVEHMDLG
jgi:3-dehydroquinate dehydratase-2